MKLSRPNTLAAATPTPIRKFSPADAIAMIDEAARSQGMPVGGSPLAVACNDFVTFDPDMLELVRKANLLSMHTHPVLILGETGTGKELIARILHGNRDSPKFMQIGIKPPSTFHAVNCSGITETLFESLLFGHMKGAYTGAVAAYPGILRDAGTGTVFFDEVGDLPMAQQTKLLRTIQSRTVRAVGSTDEVSIHCRFVFATNKNLKNLIARGEFREDLWYRISAFVLRTKPLRHRPDDVAPIVRRLCVQLGITAPVESIPIEVYCAGNVRGIINYLLRRGILDMEPTDAMVDL